MLIVKIPVTPRCPTKNLSLGIKTLNSLSLCISSIEALVEIVDGHFSAHVRGPLFVHFEQRVRVTLERVDPDLVYLFNIPPVNLNNTSGRVGHV